MILTQKLQELFPEYKSYKQLELDLLKGNNQFIVERIIAVPELKCHFFYETAGVLIFDAQKLMDFIRTNEVLETGYTKYKNKITLATDGKSIVKELGHVVLNFPFKECVLEGGMSTEDKKRKEIFYNETLAPQEITRLFEPKALTNFKSYGDRNGKINHEKDNMLIKGNNLLALHSLLPKYRGKVKLIYIDPPYNTGNDGFKYNDAFNHSTWLVFMKNRLEVARQLLAEDGVIFVQIDDNEQAYLKVLMDEVFGREGFVSNSIVVINRGGRDYGGIAKTHEYLLIFSKNKLKELNFIEEQDKVFDYEDEFSGFNLMELRNRNVLFNDKNRPNLCYPFYVNPHNKDKNGLLEISLEEKDSFIKVMPLKSQGIQTVWRWGKEKVLENLNTEIKGKEKSDGGFMIVQKYRKSIKRQRSVWDEKEFVNERGTEHIKELFKDKSFAYPKSEFLLSRIIELSTDVNDLVLDFFAGSGTTAAVAHKMGRRWIAIEQMDYVETITRVRLEKVLAGEQGGVSKNHKWTGGGSFVYFELFEWNKKFANLIDGASSKENLVLIYDEIKEQAFWQYGFEKDDAEFLALTLDEQKQLMVEMLNKNHLYCNIGEIEDATYGISKEDLAFNKEFYDAI